MKENLLDVYLCRAIKVLDVLMLIPIVSHIWGAMAGGYTNDAFRRIATAR